MDGLIRNALVCVDSNNNGLCDAGETQAHTDANGQVTIEVPTANLATARLIAVVGTDATDADTGAVKTAYTMTTPAGKLSVISPLTTMVQTQMETAKVSAEAAESYVKTQTGLKVSMFDNFIAKRASSAEHKKAGEIARLLVLSIQKSKDSSTSAANSQCVSGLSTKDADHVKETHINHGLVANLDTIRRESDAPEDESDDNLRQSRECQDFCV
jgi:hypothetical protein